MRSGNRGNLYRRQLGQGSEVILGFANLPVPFSPITMIWFFLSFGCTAGWSCVFRSARGSGRLTSGLLIPVGSLSMWSLFRIWTLIIWSRSWYSSEPTTGSFRLHLGQLEEPALVWRCTGFFACSSSDRIPLEPFLEIETRGSFAKTEFTWLLLLNEGADGTAMVVMNSTGSRLIGNAGMLPRSCELQTVRSSERTRMTER